jgi:hypothetical protein
VSQSSEFCHHNPFCAPSQRVFIIIIIIIIIIFFVVVVYFVTTQSGNFWIHPRICMNCAFSSGIYEHLTSDICIIGEINQHLLFSVEVTLYRIEHLGVAVHP